MDALQFNKLKKIAYQATYGLWVPQWATVDDLAATALMAFCEHAEKTGSYDVDGGLTHSIMRRRTIDYLRTTGDYHRHKDPEVVQKKLRVGKTTPIEWTDSEGRSRSLETVLAMVDPDATARMERQEQEQAFHVRVRRKIRKHRDYRAASMMAMFIDGVVQREIAAMYGVTESRVSQILRKVLS